MTEPLVPVPAWKAGEAATAARAIFQAYVDKDRGSAERLIAEDFHFTSPIDNRIDRATYFVRCWPNSADAVAFDFVHVVERDGQVFVTYEAATAAGKKFRNTEILTVRDGRIVEVEVYFGWDLPHKAPPSGFTG